MHHVASAEAFEPVSTIVFTRLSDLLQSDHQGPTTQVERMMELAIIVIEVRKGARVHGILFLLIE